MEEVQDYKFLIAKGSDKLSEKVNEELDNGYVLYGSPTISQVFLGMKDDVPQTLTLIGQAVVLPYPDDEDDEVEGED
jgi:hypothetical protein